MFQKVQSEKYIFLDRFFKIFTVKILNLLIVSKSILFELYLKIKKYLYFLYFSIIITSKLLNKYFSLLIKVVKKLGGINE